ncbi:MAG: radical SAM protein [Deltaproteobacteria bacterium]|nr:radical SAM protein [Deltaproteobacteria bacterium]
MNEIAINKSEQRIPVAGPFPDRITLELTNCCNLSCTFCPRKLMAKHQGYMDAKLAKCLIDEMTQYLPVTLVPFFRGESLLHPDWFEILQYAKSRGIGPLQLTSNGMRLDRQAAEKILDLELDFISFSVDTIDPEIYHQTRRGSCYEKVVHNILQFLELKQQKGTNLPQVQVSSVATELHRPGMEAFVAFWRPLVDRVRIYIEHSQDGYPGSIADPLPAFAQRRPCWKPFTDMIIYWDGQVALCNHDWTRAKTQSLGDLNRQSIAEIWNSPAYENVRGTHLSGEVGNLPPCDHCDHWKMFYLEPGYLGKIYENSSD